MVPFLQKHLDDILFLAGAGLVIGATATLSVTAALYAAGGFCLVAALFVAVSRNKGGGAI